ncbi:MAG: hypothetical protein LIO87_00355, partial [Eubacterium sp.]|nr:hypothetical protein [Eubacterium sp.]
MNNPELVDISAVKIDPAHPIDRRVNQFIKDIKNPVHFKCGDVEVQLEFNNSGESIETLLY